MTKHLLFICLLAATIFSNSAKAQCTAPSNLAVTYNNNVSTFTWDSVPGAAGYYFDIKFQWDASWGSGSGAYTSTHSYSMTGLFQTAPFTWRVATDCGSSLSSYTESLYATPCPEPTNLSAISIATTSATVAWTPAAGYNTTTSNFSVGYRLANTSNAWTSAGTTSTASKTISGLLSNTAYEFCVNQSCMYGNSNPVIGTFTTAYVACDVPATIAVSGATANQSTINWSAVNGGLNYTVEYKPTTSSAWSSVIVTNNTTTLSNLTTATLYDVRVKANCTAGISTYVSTQFTTYSAPCMAYGVNGSEYIDLFSLGTINRTSGREIGGYFNTNLTTNLAKGSTTVGQFSAGYNPGIILGENFAVYIDFNNNGSFADAGERVVAPTYVTSGSANYNFSITIPNNASQGVRKMRVIIRRSNTSITPCATGFNGEVEDYKVNIINNGNRMAANSIDNNVNDIEIAATNLMVYPNPSTGNYTVEMPENTSASWYAIYSINGSLVEKQTVNNNQFTIDLSNQNNGIYLLNVYSNEVNKIITQKLQLNK
jgi:hypothetical protein